MTKKFVAVILPIVFLLNFTTRAFALENSIVPAGNAFIPEGTILNVELTRGISSKNAKVGDQVPLRLLENLIINDVMVLESGTEVKAVITKRRKAALLGRGGKLEISVISVKAVNGLEIPLQYSRKNYGKGESGATIALLPTVATIIGGVFVTGSNIFYKPGLRFEIKISEDIDLKIPAEKLKDVMVKEETSGVTISRK